MELLIGLTVLALFGVAITGGSSKRKSYNRRKKSQARSQRRDERRSAYASLDQEDAGVRISITTGGAGEQFADFVTQDPSEYWTPPGQSCEVAGRHIPGGMLYIGTGLGAVNGLAIEPALIDPSLATLDDQADPNGSTMGYWPSYSSLSPGERSAYLDWLAGGRSDTNVTIGFPFLYLYGLERRVFGDPDWVRLSAEEVQAIAREARRLQKTFQGRSNSFDGYIHRFIGTLYTRFAFRRLLEKGPPSTEATREGSPVLQVALGTMAAEGMSVPADWALAWASGDPEIRLRTPAKRCPELFSQLFRIRYREHHGEGVVIKPGKTRLHLHYHPASASLHSTSMTYAYPGEQELPDVFALRRPRNAISKVIDQVTEELAAYSRFVGKDPDAANSLQAQALLPAVLVRQRQHGDLERFREALESALGSEDFVTMAADTLFEHFPPAKAGRPSKREAINMAQVLEPVALGFEPDARFSGAKPQGGGQVAVFRLEPGAPSAPSEAFEAASLLIRLAAMVSGADGVVSAEEKAQIERHIERGLALDRPERTRLRAHLQWLLTDAQGMSGLKNRVAAMDTAQRQTIAETLIAVAAADGEVDPAEITTLQKLYKLLELDPQQVYSQVHQAAAEPVLVRPGVGDQTQYTVPDPDSQPESAEESTAGSERTGLDETALRKKLADTQQVASLLGDIFRDQDEKAPEEGGDHGANKATEGEASIAGLDAEHSALVRALGEASSWSQDTLEALAEHHGLLLDGAIDTINEASLDRVDAPLIEETDTGYDVNQATHQEIMQ